MLPLRLTQADDLARVAVLFYEQAVAQDASVVDQPVEATHGFLGPADKRGDVGLVGDIQTADVNAAIAFGLEAFERVFFDVASGHLRARFGQSQREVTAHSLGGAGHNNTEVTEFHREGRLAETRHPGKLLMLLVWRSGTQARWSP